MEFNRRKRMRMHIDIAPLIDIVFLLLIFFMLASDFMQTKVLDLVLPESTTSREQNKNTINVFIDKNEAIAINDMIVSSDDYREKLLLHIQEMPNVSLVIHSDEEVHIGSVIRIIDSSKEAGITDILVATKK